MYFHQVPVTTLSISSGFCEEPTSLPLESFQVYALCVSEVSDGMEGCVDVQLKDYHYYQKVAIISDKLEAVLCTGKIAGVKININCL